MSTPIRTVTFSATPSGVTPDQPQFAGVQGDHNATSVVFALDEALVNAAYQYRFEFVDGAGGTIPRTLWPWKTAKHRVCCRGTGQAPDRPEPSGSVR